MKWLKKTGLTKKAIYYYIQAGILAPASESKNGYLDFSAEDLQKLLAVRKLRQLDFSVEDIRSMLTYPHTANYYLIRRLKALSEQEADLQQRRYCLESILDSLDMESALSDLLGQINAASLSAPNPADKPIDMTDARLVVTYFWGTFMRGLEMTEYRRFLLHRLMKQMVTHQNRELLSLRNFLYTLSPKETQMLFSQRDELIEEVAALKESEYPAFIEKMIASIRRNLQNSNFVRDWKANYQTFLHPSACFYDSSVRQILQEFAPRFSNYQKNINNCCEGVCAYLFQTDGIALRTELLQKLGGNIDLTGNHSGELAAFVSFYR